MAVAYGSSQGDPVLSGSSSTYAFNNVAGNALVVVAGHEWFGVNLSGITYAAAALTLSFNANYNTFYGYGGGYKMSPATGSNNVVVTLTGSDHIVSGVISLTGADTGSLDDTDATSYSTDVTTATLTLTSQTDGMVISALVGATSNNWTVDSPGTERVGQRGDFVNFLVMATHAGAASVSPTYTEDFTGAFTAIMAWAFKPSGGGGGASIVPVLMAQYRQRKA